MSKQNKKDYLIRRYIVFLTGLLICSFGVACTTKAGLGTSPVAAIPYTLALIFDKISFGSWLIIFCFFQIVVQIILLRRNTIVSDIVIQSVLAFLYGYVTDFSLRLLDGIELNHYVAQLGFSIVGCFILALGVYLELLGGVGMLSGDAFIKAIATVIKKEYGNVKIVTDISMTVFSAIISIVMLHKLVGVREGTVIAAIIVGMIIKLYTRCFKKIAVRIIPETE